MKYFIILFLAVAYVLAEESTGGVRVLGVDENGHDDGSYWPGKYWGTWHPTAYSGWPTWAGHWAHNTWAHNPWAARAWWGW